MSDTIDLKITLPTDHEATQAIAQLANRGLTPENALALRAWMTRVLQAAGRADEEGNLVEPAPIVPEPPEPTD